MGWEFFHSRVETDFFFYVQKSASSLELADLK
jgi:hypothetical protein